MSDVNEVTESARSREPTSSPEIVECADSAKLVESTESPKSAEPTESPEIDEAAESSEPGEIADNPESPKTLNSTKPNNPANPAEPIKSIEPTEASPTWVLIIDQSKFNTANGIKAAATLSDKDFKTWQAKAASYIKNDTGELSTKRPRSLGNDVWAKVTNQLLDEAGLGRQLWNKDREGFDPADHLVYPRDRYIIRNLVFSLLKFEAQKQARSAKREHDGAEGAAKASPAKKAKTIVDGKDKTPAKTLTAKKTLTDTKDKTTAKTPTVKKSTDASNGKSDAKNPAKNPVGSPEKKPSPKTSAKKFFDAAKEKAPAKTPATKKKSSGAPKTKPGPKSKFPQPVYQPRVVSAVWPPAEEDMVGHSSYSKPQKPKPAVEEGSDDEASASPSPDPIQQVKKAPKGKNVAETPDAAVVTIVDGELVADPASPTDTLARLIDSETADIIASRDRNNGTFTPSLTPADAVALIDAHNRAVTEPASTGISLQLDASLAIAATSATHAQLLPRVPLHPYRTVSFSVYLVSTDPEITMSLSQNRQALQLKPVDLSYHKFIGIAVLGLRNFTEQVVFHAATQCKVRVGTMAWTFDKGGEGAGKVWQTVMTELVGGSVDSVVNVIFFPY